MKELRVLDRTGLVRAAAKIAGTGTISTCPISEAHSMSLTSLDSIDRTVIGQAMQKPNTAFTCYQFKNVEAGNWEIRIDPPENRPREVSIKKDQ